MKPDHQMYLFLCLDIFLKVIFVWECMKVVAFIYFYDPSHFYEYYYLTLGNKTLIWRLQLHQITVAYSLGI